MRDLEMAFLGKIAASMTHEINNALAIILESSGLLSDFIALSQDAAFPHKDKFQRVLGNINDQVNRGVNINTRLNQFAHSMDEPLAEISVNDLLERVVLLMRRLAKRQGIVLTAEPSEPDLSLSGDLFRLQLVLATVIEHLIQALEPEARISLHAESGPQKVIIALSTEGTRKPQRDRLEEELHAGLKEVLEMVQARLAMAAAPYKEGVIITVPVAPQML